GKGYVEARVVHSFGREDQLDRAALERLVRSIRRVLGEDAAGNDRPPSGELAIERVEELGIAHVARALWEQLGIGAAISARMLAQRHNAPHRPGPPATHL